MTSYKNLIMKKIDPEEIFAEGDKRNIQAFLRLLEPLEIVDLLDEVSDKYYPLIAKNLDLSDLSAILPLISARDLEILIEYVTHTDLIEAVNRLETDDAAWVISILPEDKQELILAGLTKTEQIRSILSYPDESAGQLMKTEICSILEGISIEQAVEAIRKYKSTTGRVQSVFVVGPDKTLKGHINLDDFILTAPEESINKITRPIQHWVLPTLDQEKVSKIFSNYDLSFLPVVNDEGKILGQITFDDIFDVVEKESVEDAMVNAGLPIDEGPGESTKNNIMQAISRMPWIWFSIGASMVTSIILKHFNENALEAIIYFAFVPLVQSTTGNVGTQSAMIMTRSFALGRNQFGRFNLPILHELGIGVFLSLISGTTAMLLIFALRNNFLLSFKIGLTMIVSMSAATLVGLTMPIIFKQLKIDPAIASGPLVTSCCDILSVSVYLVIILLTQ